MNMPNFEPKEILFSLELRYTDNNSIKVSGGFCIYLCENNRTDPGPE